jgi:hypothetical protein
MTRVWKSTFSPRAEMDLTRLAAKIMQLAPPTTPMICKGQRRRCLPPTGSTKSMNGISGGGRVAYKKGLIEDRTANAREDIIDLKSNIQVCKRPPRHN